ncbi:hypothetical protein ACOME3_002690 [Neoechinorhynchus agilis]
MDKDPGKKRKFAEQIELNVEPKTVCDGRLLNLLESSQLEFKYLVNPYDGMVRGFSIVTYGGHHQSVIERAIKELNGYEVRKGVQISVSRTGTDMYLVRGIPGLRSQSDVEAEARRILSGIARSVAKELMLLGYGKPEDMDYDFERLQEIEESSSVCTRLVFPDPLGPNSNKRACNDTECLLSRRPSPYPSLRKRKSFRL